MAIALCLGGNEAYAQQRNQITSEGDPVVSAGAEARMEQASQGASSLADSHLRHSATGEYGRGGASITSAPSADFVVDRTFEAYDFLDNGTLNGVFFIPPDPIGAASESQLIAVGNSLIEAHSKEGTLNWRAGLRDFFAPLEPESFPFDPKIVYDHYEGRFVVVVLELVEADPPMDVSSDNKSRIFLAVSKDGDPQTPTVADWYFFAINSRITQLIPGIGDLDFWADYPGFEYDEEAIYITANLFSFSDVGGFGGVRLWIVDKGAGTGGFYDGGAAAHAVHDPYATAGIATTTMPALVYDGSLGPDVGTYLVSYSGLSDGVDEYVQVVRVDDPLGTPTFVHQFINVGNIEDLLALLPDAPQLGTDRRIEVNDRRALDAVWRDGFLWFTTTIEPNTGPDAGETTAHWFKLNATGGPVTPAQQGNISGDDIAPNTFTFFPAVAVNGAGAAVFGFSASAETIYPGAYVTGRLPGDPPGTVRPSEVVHEGEDYYVRTFSTNPAARNRWGDYSGIALDPTDENIAWVFNEYAEERGLPFLGEDGIWGTAWARLVIEAEAIVDDERPVCEIVERVRSSHIRVRVQDPESGLATIEVLQAQNANVTVPAFTPGTNEALLVNAEKIDESQKSIVVLRVTDVAGNQTTCDPVVERLTAELPEGYRLEQNHPNPFNPTTAIRFALPEAVHVRLEVYDLLGRRVLTLLDEAMEPGTYDAIWDGRDEGGAVLAGGTYLYRLQAGAHTETRTMTLIR